MNHAPMPEEPTILFRINGVWLVQNEGPWIESWIKWLREATRICYRDVTPTKGRLEGWSHWELERYIKDRVRIHPSENL